MIPNSTNYFSVFYFISFYLVRTPVPHRRNGHANDDAGPGQVRVHWVSEQAERIGSWYSTGGVWHTDGWYGLVVFLHQGIPASDLNEASTQTRTFGQNTALLMIVSHLECDLLKPMRVRAPANMMAV